MLGYKIVILMNCWRLKMGKSVNYRLQWDPIMQGSHTFVSFSSRSSNGFSQCRSEKNLMFLAAGRGNKLF